LSNEWKKKMWNISTYLHIHAYCGIYSALERKMISLFETTWQTLRILYLHKIRQAQTNKYCMSLWESKQAELLEEE
jgi:hypothetical protein